MNTCHGTQSIAENRRHYWVFRHLMAQEHFRQPIYLESGFVSVELIKILCVLYFVILAIVIDMHWLLYNGQDRRFLLLLERKIWEMTLRSICVSRLKEDTNEKVKEHLHGFHSGEIEILERSFEFERRKRLIEGKDRGRTMLLVNVKGKTNCRNVVVPIGYVAARNFWLSSCYCFNMP